MNSYEAQTFFFCVVGIDGACRYPRTSATKAAMMNEGVQAHDVERSPPTPKEMRQRTKELL